MRVTRCTNIYKVDIPYPRHGARDEPLIFFIASADDRIRTIPGGLGKIGELDDEEWARGLSLASQLSSLIAVSVSRYAS